MLYEIDTGTLTSTETDTNTKTDKKWYRIYFNYPTEHIIKTITYTLLTICYYHNWLQTEH
jgi:hypothetical protein